MTKTRMIGWTAMAICVLGYLGGAAVLIAGRMDYLDMTQAIVMGGVVLLAGEAGLWVAAGCLGLTIFKKRKAIIDRLLRRNRSVEPTLPA